MEQERKILLQVQDRDGHVLVAAAGEDSAHLNYKNEYQPGDCILVEVQGVHHLFFSADEKLPESMVFVKKTKLRYPIPFGEGMQPYPPRAFQGGNHLISARAAAGQDILQYRNLSLNPLDVRGETDCYPHCTANVETRGESVFAARNTIDGVAENTCHGEWPYQSWGDDENPDAEIIVEFGRTVCANKIIVYLRADFPHDNYWKQVTFLFSDGTKLTVPLEKTKQGQEICFESKDIEWVKMTQLIRSEEESLFPALTQWEVYGTDLGFLD
jgi:hypothetical protein